MWVNLYSHLKARDYHSHWTSLFNIFFFWPRGAWTDNALTHSRNTSLGTFFSLKPRIGFSLGHSSPSSSATLLLQRDKSPSKMAPAFTRSLYTSPLTSVPFTPTTPSSPRNQPRLSHLRTAFLPRGSVPRTGVSCSWNLEKRCNRFAVKCDAAVAEKETAEEGYGEKFEYQAEVSSKVSNFTCGHVSIWLEMN